MHRRLSFSLLRDQTHLSPVQEAPLLWQPHTCEGRAGVIHTHTHWQTVCSGRPTQLLISLEGVARVSEPQEGCIHSCIRHHFYFQVCLLPWWSLTSNLWTHPISCHFGLLKWWESNIHESWVTVMFSEAELLSLVGFNFGVEPKSIQWLEFCKMENTVNESFLLIHYVLHIATVSCAC